MRCNMVKDPIKTNIQDKVPEIHAEHQIRDSSKKIHPTNSAHRLKDEKDVHLEIMCISGMRENLRKSK